MQLQVALTTTPEYTFGLNGRGKDNETLSKVLCFAMTALTGGFSLYYRSLANSYRYFSGGSMWELGNLECLHHISNDAILHPHAERK